LGDTAAGSDTKGSHVKGPEPAPGQASRLERVIFYAGCAFLLFVGGLLFARLGWFPYSLVDNAVTAARATAIRQGWIPDGVPGSDGERTDALAGVTAHAAQLSAGGYTAFTTGFDEAAFLIDMSGEVRHRWSMPAGALRERFGSGQVPDGAILNWRSFHLFANGDLLVVLQRSKFTPYGFAVVKLDKDSRILWANFNFAHHDVTVDEQGRVYTIGQAIRPDDVPGLGSIQAPFLEDFVLVLAPDGRTIHRHSVMEAFAGTPFARSVSQLVKVRDWKGDYFHVNGIEPYDSRNPIAVLRENQVLVSVRNMDALATLDLATGKIVWLLKGSWLKQHDPDLVAGRIMLFDNRGDFARGSRSRILELDPLTQGVTWQATVGDGYDLYSGWGGSQQALENGNVLITETAPGRLLELTRDGRLAWVYHNAAKDEDGKYSVPILEARRYAASFFEFEFSDPRLSQVAP
jgi:hypothetical protein